MHTTTYCNADLETLEAVKVAAEERGAQCWLYTNLDHAVHGQNRLITTLGMRDLSLAIQEGRRAMVHARLATR